MHTQPSEVRSLPATIRPVRLADADSLKRLCWPDRSLDNVFLLLQRALKLAHNERGLAVITEVEGAACGFGMLTLWPRAAEISDLVVAERWRGQGLGTRIITHLMRAAADLHVVELEIGVALSNPGALRLYRHMGFVDSRTLQLDLGCGPEPVLYLTQQLARR